MAHIFAPADFARRDPENQFDFGLRLSPLGLGKP